MANLPRPVPRTHTRSMPASIKPVPAPRSLQTMRSSPESIFEVSGWNETKSDNSPMKASLTKGKKKKGPPPPLAELGLPDDSALDDWLGKPVSPGTGLARPHAADQISNSRHGQVYNNSIPSDIIPQSFPRKAGVNRAGSARDPAWGGLLARGGGSTGSIISLSSLSSSSSSSSSSGGSFCSNRGSFNSLPKTAEVEEGVAGVPPPFGFEDTGTRYESVDHRSLELYANIEQGPVARSFSAPPPKSLRQTAQRPYRGQSDPTPPPLPPPNIKMAAYVTYEYDIWTDPAEMAMPQYANASGYGVGPTHSSTLQHSSHTPLPTTPGTVDKEIEECMAEILRLQSLQVTSARTFEATEESEPVYDQLQSP